MGCGFGVLPRPIPAKYLAEKEGFLNRTYLSWGMMMGYGFAMGLAWPREQGESGWVPT